MALRLRYQIDSPGSMREHLHFVEGAGYFFFPGVAAPKGTLATLEVDFESTGQVTLLRGWVWARSTGAAQVECPFRCDIPGRSCGRDTGGGSCSVGRLRCSHSTVKVLRLSHGGGRSATGLFRCVATVMCGVRVCRGPRTCT